MIVNSIVKHYMFHFWHSDVSKTHVWLYFTKSEVIKYLRSFCMNAPNHRWALKEISLKSGTDNSDHKNSEVFNLCVGECEKRWERERKKERDYREIRFKTNMKLLKTLTKVQICKRVIIKLMTIWHIFVFKRLFGERNLLKKEHFLRN